ncbi:MAG: M16 family metallopeptidase [Candidatus Bruticola sp.]
MRNKYILASLINRKIWLVGVVCALFIWASSAAYSVEAQSRQNYYSEVLPNGMLLVLSENLSSPICSLNIFCKVGGFEENAETMGISHFFEHLFFRGTPTLNGYQFKRAIEALGGQTNASTGRDFTHYYITLPGKNAIKGMHLLADALKNAELDQEAIDQERKAVLEEYRMNLESPARIMNQMMSELAYGDHPYGRPIIGSEYTIKSFNRPDFIKFRDTFISPERTSIIVTGDFKSSEMLAVLREEFSGFTRPQKRLISNYADIKRPDKEISAVRDIKAQSSFVSVGFVGPSIHNKPDIYQVDVMSFLMGLGRGSLVQKELVGKGKLQDGGVQFLTQRFPGLISLYGIGKVGSEESIKKDLLSVAEMVRRGQFSERDLRRAKAFLRSNYSFSEETNAGRADNLGFYASIDDIKFTDRYLNEIDKVSKEEVIAAAHKYLSGGYYCVKLVGQVSEKTKRSRNGEKAESGQTAAGTEVKTEERPGQHAENIH